MGSPPLPPIDEVFPFFLSVDRDLRISACGPLLLRVCPEAGQVGVSLLDCFAPQGSWAQLKCFEDHAAKSGQPLTLRRNRPPQQLFKGAWYPVPGGEGLSFLGWPIIADAAQLSQLGLTLKDLPEHCLLGDLLMMAQINQNTLADARALTGRLHERARQLEAANAKLENEAVLIQQRDDAEAANRAKSKFLTSMSHELRTPLNAVLGFAELLELDLADRPELAENAHEILQAGRHLVRLVDDLLDLARIESGGVTLSLQPVCMGDVVESALALVRLQAQQQGIRLLFQPDVGCDPWALADKDRLRQVLVNLLSNAVKYNRKEGRVEVRVNQSGQTVRLAVIDTGLGISEEAQRQLFKPFNRLGREAGRIEGTGIGLVIAQRLIHAMGGEINLQSTVDVGTEFAVDLKACTKPIAKADPA